VYILPEKVVLVSNRIQFLGHILSEEGIEVNPERVQDINDLPRPQNLRAVRRFLGMVSFYARFIPRFSELVGPLNFLKRKNVKFVWGELQELAFKNLKTALSQPPTLRVPNFDKKFILQCDSSDQAIAAVLNQKEDGHLAPIGYAIGLACLVKFVLMYGVVMTASASNPLQIRR
jgi:hypothetical protein